MKGSATEALRERISPEQPVFGTNPHLQEKTAEEAPPEETGPPKGDFSELRLINTVAVDQIIDPLRILLRGGQIIQLAGIDIPDLDAHEPGDISAAAHSFLSQWLTDKQVRMYQTKDAKKGRTNRMGHTLAHLESRDDEVWVQGALLEAGLARVRPTERNPEMAAQMLRLEDKARTQKKGLWAYERFDPYTPETAASGMGDLVLVEGRIHSVATIRNVVYLNFGPDWRTDFTIGIDSTRRRQLSGAGIDVMNLNNRRVKVRGWLENYNGPYIALNHAVWLEVLPKEAAGSIN